MPPARIGRPCSLRSAPSPSSVRDPLSRAPLSRRDGTPYPARLAFVLSRYRSPDRKGGDGSDPLSNGRGSDCPYGGGSDWLSRRAALGVSASGIVRLRA